MDDFSADVSASQREETRRIIKRFMKEQRALQGPSEISSSSGSRRCFSDRAAKSRATEWGDLKGFGGNEHQPTRQACGEIEKRLRKLQCEFLTARKQARPRSATSRRESGTDSPITPENKKSEPNHFMQHGFGLGERFSYDDMNEEERIQYMCLDVKRFQFFNSKHKIHPAFTFPRGHVLAKNPDDVPGPGHYNPGFKIVPMFESIGEANQGKSFGAPKLQAADKKE